MTTPKVLAIIPARYAAQRFPGKVIALIAGKPLVQHAYERAVAAARVDEAIVAIDDARVAEALAPYGTPTVMTSAKHATGSDRIAEVAAARKEEFIVNLQADEPLIHPQTIDDAIQALLDKPHASMSTVKRRLKDPEAIQDPNNVKVVCDARGDALYFSRAPVPFVRDPREAEGPAVYWHHYGLYVYRRAFLLEFTRLPQTPLERLEKLEQLRALEHGHAIAVIEAHHDSIGVDAPDDIAKVEALLKDQE